MDEEVGRRVEVGAPTHERLLAAAAEELRADGHASLTVRRVARRAGVSSATAYKVFASKQHLLASVFLRLLRALPDEAPTIGRRPLEDRIAAFADSLARRVADDPGTAAALRSVFLGDDADTVRVRELVVADVERRLDAVLGDELDAEAATTVRLAFAGAMLTAGAGLVGFDAVGGLVAAAARSVR